MGKVYFAMVIAAGWLLAIGHFSDFLAGLMN
jgi:hypothetical protein